MPTRIRNIMLNNSVDTCPEEIIYTRKNLPSFHAPLMDVKNASIEQSDIKLPALMKDGSIKEVTLSDWRIQCHFEGMDRWFNPFLIEGGANTIPDSHVEIWCNENNNNGQYVYAKPSFPVEAVCVDRNYNADGLYLFLREPVEKPWLESNQEKWDSVSHFFMELVESGQEVVTVPGVTITEVYSMKKLWVDYRGCATPDSLIIEVSRGNGTYSSRWVATWGDIRVERIYDRDHSHLVEYSF